MPGITACLVSGGFDSLYSWIKELQNPQSQSIVPVFIDYGHYAREEEWCAVLMQYRLFLDMQTIDTNSVIPPVRLQIGDNAFSWIDSPIFENTFDTSQHNDYSSYDISGRNQLFFSMTHSYLLSRRIGLQTRAPSMVTIRSGLRESEFNDSTDRFLKCQEQLLNISTPAVKTIIMPTLKISQMEIFEELINLFGEKLTKTLLSSTITCFRHNQMGQCHNCPKCRERRILIRSLNNR